MIKKILIANRGEIAVRIIRTANEMGIDTVAVYAEDDKASLHVSKAQSSISLGNGELSETYLNIDKLIQIAKQTGSDAIHPGYGFLSENKDFAEACKTNSLIFIGPSIEVLEKMGNKAEARKTVKQLDIPVIEGYECTEEELLSIKNIQFPIIIKPALGGGGKGMNVAYDLIDLKEKITKAKREASSFFANDLLYFEHYIEKARHIEVQILGDNFGNIIHLFERECTIQRNFQKIIEEAPSPSLSINQRTEITEAAAAIAKSIDYTNAGTIEFLFDEIGNWYFIEMNTRIQVEHPVTEAITGIDIVRQQILISSGLPLVLNQNDISITGHSIEVRINSENPMNDFRPSAGPLSLFQKPKNCRIDSFIEAPLNISPQYDSMLAKLIVHAENREVAINEMLIKLSKTHIHGIQNNISFLKALLNSKQFNENTIHTRFCNEFVKDFSVLFLEKQNRQNIEYFIIAFVYFNFQKKIKNAQNIWESIGYWREHQEICVNCEETNYKVKFYINSDKIIYIIDNKEFNIGIQELSNNSILILKKDIPIEVFFSLLPEGISIIEIEGDQKKISSPNLLKTAFVAIRENNSEIISSEKLIKSPLYGKVLRIVSFIGKKVNRGEVLVVIEAMKTENLIKATGDGVVKAIHVIEGAQVKDNEVLIEFE